MLSSFLFLGLLCTTFSTEEVIIKRILNDTQSAVLQKGYALTGQIILYEITPTHSPFLRLRSHANASVQNPLFWDIRTTNRQYSWVLPHTIADTDQVITQTITQTICSGLDDRTTIQITTQALDPVYYSLAFWPVWHYLIESSKPKKFNLVPYEPVYYHGVVPKGARGVILKVLSPQDYCARVTIKQYACYDQKTNKDKHYSATSHVHQLVQTFTTQAAIMIYARDFPEFDVTFFMSQSQADCYSKRLHDEQTDETFDRLLILAAKSQKPTGKTISFIVDPLEARSYMAIVYFTIMVFGMGVSVLLVCTVPPVVRMLQFPSKPRDCSTKIFPTKRKRSQSEPSAVIGSYLYSLLVIAAFYLIPAMQLLVHYYTTSYETGNQDSCYYNFLCAKPLGPFVAFNNVYSNIGYVVFGLMFAATARLHKKRFSWRFMEVFYALSVALVLEGVLSAGYHICPSAHNFQFDTTFMYIIAGLCTYHQYQIRNPGALAHPYKFYGIFALAIMFTVISILSADLGVQIFVTVLYALTALSVGAMIIWMLYMKNDPLQKHTWCRNGMCVLQTAFNLALLGFAMWSLLKSPESFPSILLNTFIGNLFLYTILYFVVKCLCNEVIVAGPIICTIMSFGFWTASLYFYSTHVTNWQFSPAHSRALNSECIFLDFFDQHDVWHVMSAFSLYMSFLLLLTLDDGQENIGMDPYERVAGRVLEAVALRQRPSIGSLPTLRLLRDDGRTSTL